MIGDFNAKIEGKIIGESQEVNNGGRKIIDIVKRNNLKKKVD